MMKKLDTTPTLFQPADAVRKAAELQDSDPEWTYTATNPDGNLGPYSAIAIHDEDGEFIAHV